jgi:hypothetical protein
LLAGKLSAISLLIVVCALLSGLAAIGSAFALAPLKGFSTSAWASTDGLVAAGKMISRLFGAQLVFGSVGTCLAMLFKAPTPAISIGLAWTMLIEILLGTISKSVGKFLPGQLAGALVDGGNTTIGFRIALIGGAAWIVFTAGLSMQRLRRLEIA